MSISWKQGMSNDVEVGSAEVGLPLDTVVYSPSSSGASGRWVVDTANDEYYFYVPENNKKTTQYLFVNLDSVAKSTDKVYYINPLVIKTVVNDQICTNEYKDKWVVPYSKTENVLVTGGAGNEFILSSRRSIRIDGETKVRFKVMIEGGNSKVSILKRSTYCNMFYIC